MARFHVLTSEAVAGLQATIASGSRTRAITAVASLVRTTFNPRVLHWGPCSPMLLPKCEAQPPSVTYTRHLHKAR